MDIPLFVAAICAVILLGSISNSLERIADSLDPKKKD